MIIEVTVTTGAKRFSLSFKDGRLKAALTKPPENNKANLELIKEMSKSLGREVRIVSGQTSRRKKLSADLSEAEWSAFLESLGSP